VRGEGRLLGIKLIKKTWQKEEQRKSRNQSKKQKRQKRQRNTQKSIAKPEKITWL